MKYFYCAKKSRKGDIILKQSDVHRITEEMCIARCATGRCPRSYRIYTNCKIYKDREKSYEPR